MRMGLSAQNTIEAATIVNQMLGGVTDEGYVDAHKGELRIFPDVSHRRATSGHDDKKENRAETWIELRA